LPWDFICARQIKDLQEYDDKHNTKLNETLETYLRLERNVVQTAKALFIHRSTLFYRLERIQKIINANLDDPKTRLYLEISYYMNK
jgi:DNA-binding PucR family transcriptional regulator